MGDVTGAGDDDHAADDGPYIGHLGEYEIAEQVAHQLDEGDRWVTVISTV